MRRRSLLLLLLVLLGCADKPRTPEQVLRDFLRAMADSATDPTSLRRAYHLLDDAGQAALEARAMQARTLSGRLHEPWEMLAPGRARLRFAPATPGGMRVQSRASDRVVVVVRGAREGQQARVPMVHEAGRWRVVLRLPDASGG